MILAELKKRGMLPVTEIARALRLSVRATSKHLRILRDAGIVMDRKRGLYVYCRLSLAHDEVVGALLRRL